MSSLQTLLINARSIRNKLLEFRALVSSENLSIAAVTESWLNTDTRDFIGEYQIPGYITFQKNRTLREGGGVLLYVKALLNPVKCNTNLDQEVLCVDLHLSEIIYRIILLYRPPHQNIDKDRKLYEGLSDLMEGRQCLLLGDFNSHVNWESRSGDPAAERLIHFADDLFLTQWVNEPTRGNRMLDLVFTSEDNNVEGVEVGEPLGSSDHNTVRFSLLLPTSNSSPSTRNRLDFRHADFMALKEGIHRMEVPRLETLEGMWENFKVMFFEEQAKYVPQRRAYVASHKPKWFNQEIATAIKNRKMMYKKTNGSQSTLHKHRYTQCCRNVKKLVRTAKRNEELRVARLCKESPKEFFSYVKSRKPIKESIGPLKDREGNISVSDQDVATVLNNYFSTVFTAERSVELPNLSKTHSGCPLSRLRCTVNEVELKLKNLDKYKSPGPDGFLPRILREVSSEVSTHLTSIFNRSLETGEVPLDWRMANVTPIFKKGDHERPENFRPVSLTSVVGKILESIIKDKIVEYLDSNQLIADTQHGFRSRRSTLTNLLEFFHKMFVEYDKNRAIDILYLDFQKAFDKVPHKRLMIKVRSLGIDGEVARWVENWLYDRRQRVVVNGSASDWSPVTSGVPQGSVLGPLLFIIYINDLDDGLVSKVSKFADDTKLGSNVAQLTGVESLREDLRKLGEWSEKWQMPFNLGKCKVMHIGSANPRSDYSLLGSDIECTEVEKDLGVVISSDMKFSQQCIEVEKKAQKLLGYIRRQFQYRDKETVLTLYNSLVRPHLEYAVQFWSPTLRKDIERLERVQARATKLVSSIKNKGYERRLRELNLFTLESRRLRGQLIELFKILKGFSDVDYRKMFTLNQNPTRNNGWKLELRRYNTSVCGNFFTYRILNVWNGLPDDVVSSSSVEQFKNRLDKILHTLNA